MNVRLRSWTLTVYVHPSSHAAYYPGAKPIALKLLFNDEGKILGAQAFGEEGVDKRIDVIATTLRMNGTVEDLTELELTYAPPFSSAKDPVNMIGYLAQNVLSGRTEVATLKELEFLDPERHILLDVRTKAEYHQGHIEGALHFRSMSHAAEERNSIKGKKSMLTAPLV
ncbi:hypothetical protein J2T17_000010 [Paenibacillus mucilaginosus]